MVVALCCVAASSQTEYAKKQVAGKNNLNAVSKTATTITVAASITTATTSSSTKTATTITEAASTTTATTSSAVKRVGLRV
ncbi:spore coat protein SP96-like [Trichogramma pretiosum]|uniref:spore coat protein SP96-like n=1 Tax=Trichogramma pretiosum TaxID=7493 RepID=UPI0006C9955C|nr:spore coat protein SP96-like [Trichogramma pretiosum]XP_023318967.1 spore coat protein SP96-like [Trichogramma pretiosum]XP_023318985.1 spore coat protein SP96-like [Trichogramma pretiosum]XP_023318986.1 spore coat protein SP96-like [Trichogramma pretiosum]